MFGLGRRSTKKIKSAEKPYRDWHDVASLSVNTLGLIAVVATIIITLRLNAENGQETQDAITNMASMARSMHDQQPILLQQADALTNTASAAQTSARNSSRQLDTFKKQTDAIVRQANALVGSAQATVVAAQAQLESARANTKTAEAGAKAADEQLRSATLLATTRVPVAKVVAVDITNWQINSGNVPVKIGLKPTLANAGGGALIPGSTTFNMIIGMALPLVRPAESQHTFGGNEYSVAPGTSYSPVKPFEYTVEKTDIDALTDHTKAMIVWGTADYTDTSGTPYRLCYLDVVSMPISGDAGGSVRPIDLPGYRCPPTRK